MADPDIQVRDQPSLTATAVATARRGDRFEVSCYTTGPALITGWGGTNRFWDLITDPTNPDHVLGYLPDVWLDTGGTITTHVQPCRHPPQPPQPALLPVRLS